ncbi:hypothetical protein Hamer_G009431, partial [Homarus americanus]
EENTDTAVILVVNRSCQPLDVSINKSFKESCCKSDSIFLIIHVHEKGWMDEGGIQIWLKKV